ncbi:MAG: two-component system response regulator [Kordiimonas sp.]
MQTGGLNNLSIMLALSHMQAADGLKSVLMQQKIRKVFFAANNREAVSQLQEQSYNMILIEEGFPELGGADFCRFLRMTDGPMAVAPIIYGIVSAEKERVFAARDAGASKIVLMPLSPKVLLQTIQAAIKEMRPIIQTNSYRGPDRRITGQKPFHGADKRKAQYGLISVAEQKRIIGSF